MQNVLVCREAKGVSTHELHRVMMPHQLSNDITSACEHNKFVADMQNVLVCREAKGVSTHELHRVMMPHQLVRREAKGVSTHELPRVMTSRQLVSTTNSKGVSTHELPRVMTSRQLVCREAKGVATHELPRVMTSPSQRTVLRVTCCYPVSVRSAWRFCVKVRTILCVDVFVMKWGIWRRDEATGEKKSEDDHVDGRRSASQPGLIDESPPRAALLSLDSFLEGVVLESIVNVVSPQTKDYNGDLFFIGFTQRIGLAIHLVIQILKGSCFSAS
ncbi:hypothetical protein J6590_070089 [Homalodisca vitripennis]|nr:hypothetical protein J6590_070089 [Homalodisca vitripennis]